MENIFDAFQDNVFNVVTTTMGYNALWNTASNTDASTAQVLYKDATEKQGLGDVDYMTERYMMEYKAGDFDGLKQSVDTGNDERITITVKGAPLSFLVRRIESKYDGKTYIAILQPI